MVRESAACVFVPAAAMSGGRLGGTPGADVGQGSEDCADQPRRDAWLNAVKRKPTARNTDSINAFGQDWHQQRTDSGVPVPEIANGPVPCQKSKRRR
jgi:hypothetical protein